MTTATESREALELVAATAVAEAVALVGRVAGTPEARRAALLEAVPALIAYYADATSALAADFYDEQRELAAVSAPFMATPIVADRVEKQRRAVAWAAETLFEGTIGSTATLESRLSEVVQSETVRPYRDTILENRNRDPEAVGWKRIANPGACSFCLMLAGRGTVYRSKTVRFASHENCLCSAAPVFGKDDVGPEVTRFQYMASIRQRTPAQKAELREYLKANFADGLDDMVPGDILGSLARSNPNYSLSASYRANCANAVTAFEMQMRGRPLVAQGVSVSEVAAGGIQVDRFLARWLTPGGQVPIATQVGSRTGAVAAMREAGDGSRGFVFVQWTRAYGGGGHVLAAVNDGGTIRFLDPQSGVEYADDIFKNVMGRRTWFTRADNLSVVESALEGAVA